MSRHTGARELVERVLDRGQLDQLGRAGRGPARMAGTAVLGGVLEHELVALMRAGTLSDVIGPG